MVSLRPIQSCYDADFIAVSGTARQNPRGTVRCHRFRRTILLATPEKMALTNYYLNRTVQALLTLVAVVTLTFVLIRFMPGGPVDYIRAQMVQSGQNVDPAAIDRRVELYTSVNPSQPIYLQYIDYVGNLVHGNLGQSTYYTKPVAAILGDAMPWTVFVMAVSLVLSFAIGIALGAVMAYGEGGRFDVSSSVVSIVVSSVPYYVVGLLLLWVLGYQWGVFPTGGRVNPDIPAGANLAFVVSVLRHGVLPIASFVLAGFGIRALSMRGNSIQVLGNDYLRVARLRGLSERRIALRYVGRNALLPMYTSIMIAIGSILGGSIILERIYAYPGVGYYVYQSIGPRDYPLMMGGFLVITVGILVGVYIADLTYGLVDPQASTGGSRESF